MEGRCHEVQLTAGSLVIVTDLWVRLSFHLHYSSEGYGKSEIRSQLKVEKLVHGFATMILMITRLEKLALFCLSC